MSNQIKCILWGGYGWGNAGDELTLAAAVRDMKARFGDSVAILSPVPGYTMALFPDVPVVHHRALVGRKPSPPIRSIPERAWLKARRFLGQRESPLPPKSINERLEESAGCEWVESLRGAELLYLVGGGYLTDLFDLDQFYTPMEVANHYGVGIESAPLGIGPFRNDAGLERLKHALGAAPIRVRDPDSLAICQKFGIDAAQCPDDGFRVAEEIDFLGVEARENVLGVNFFSQHGADDAASTRVWWRALLAGVRREGIEVEGFCFHNQISSDFSQTMDLLNEVGLESPKVCPPDLDFRDACRRIATYRGIVTTRFHATVVANVVRVPTLATANGAYYRAKMDVAVAGSSLGKAVDPMAMPVEDALAMIRQWFAKPAQNSKRVV